MRVAIVFFPSLKVFIAHYGACPTTILNRSRCASGAVGVMQKNSAGKLAMTLVTLHPEVLFSGDNQPSRQQIADMHHQAHDECFIANSVKTEVRCMPIFVTVFS